MAGHGSAPPPDRANESGRVVHRDSGMHSEEGEHGRINEYRPPVGSGSKLSDRGTRYAWTTSTDMFSGGRGGSVRTLQRARAALRITAQRRAEGRDRYSGL
jgi:hypothetical protein